MCLRGVDGFDNFKLISTKPRGMSLTEDLPRRPLQRLIPRIFELISPLNKYIAKKFSETVTRLKQHTPFILSFSGRFSPISPPCSNLVLAPPYKTSYNPLRSLTFLIYPQLLTFSLLTFSHYIPFSSLLPSPSEPWPPSSPRISSSCSR